MADPRKVPFVTLASYSTSSTPGSDCKKRRREEDEEVANLHHGRDGAVGAGPGSAAVSTGLFSNGKSSGAEGAAGTGASKPTVRLSLSLSEPSDKTFTEFNYTELVQATQQVKKPPDGLRPALDPNDPLADQDRERQEVEALARKFESKYGGTVKKKKRDRMQDLIDIGYGYDETDPFIDNSEAYDELVPASLTTKLGGFYINTGTLQFRPASESEDEHASKDGNHFKKIKDGEERVIKRRKKKQDGTLEEKKPRKNRVPKPGVSALNRPEKKKRKKLMKDSLTLAAMLRRFTREKEEMRKKNPAAPAAGFKPPNGNRVVSANPVAPVGDLADLTNDPSVMPLLGSASDDMLQDLMGELDFSLLDPSETLSLEGQAENGGAAQRGGPSSSRVQRTSLVPPPPLPGGLPAPLAKRIEDLRAASRQFDVEGRKKFFTLDMNNILLDIELQVQEQPVEVRSAVYSHLEAFVPCNKEALLKRLKKLSLNVQDDRLRNPLLKLKLAVCSAMPEQIARYNMDCLAKVAKQQSEEGERNGSEEEDDERPGKRVMGPRKKFVWDDKLRTLLCNLVRAKLGCYEAEGQNSPSPEDYLKAFMETEVKPLWPKGWMQARMLIKESRMAHSHLTGNTVKKRMVPAPKAKPKPQDGGWLQQSTMPTATPPASLPQCPSSPSELICLSDSLDEDLGGAPSMDSISQALALLSSAAKGLIGSDGPSSPEGPKAVSAVGPPSSVGSASPQTIKKTANATTPQSTTGPLIISSSSAVSSSPSLVVSRPALTAPSVRAEGPTGVKAANASLAVMQRQAIMHPRPVSTTSVVNKTSTANKPSAAPSAKPRPPPTASPLLPPLKGFGTPLAGSSGLHKPNSSVVRIVATTPSSQPHSSALSISSSSTFSPSPSSSTPPSTSSSSPHLNPKPQPKPAAPSTPAQPKPQPHHPPLPQSTFVTPMQATLTKSPHSANSPILKLTPRVTPTSSPSPSLPRTPAVPGMHQYSSKSPAFHAGFAGVGAGYGAPVGQPKNSSQATSAGLASTPGPVAKHPASVSGSASHGQRQRSVGGANQGAKPMVSVSSAAAPQLAQVSSASSTLLATGAANLPLGFGMLGGITPVSLPFPFPSLMNLPTVTGTNSGANTANQSSSGYSLQPNLLKGLMSGAALPPHLQLAFPDVSQSQSGDLKRKL